MQNKLFSIEKDKQGSLVTYQGGKRGKGRERGRKRPIERERQTDRKRHGDRERTRKETSREG
jgi:hypothetical protein